MYVPIFSWVSCRLFCANLHYNENSKRQQARSADGKLRWAITFPKALKGEKAVAKPVRKSHLIVSNRDRNNFWGPAC